MNNQPASTTNAANHPDDTAVDKFAAAMKEKMAKQRAKGYGGWEDPQACPPALLQKMLIDHIIKGDPVDVGNFAMMLFARGESTFLNQFDSEMTKLRPETKRQFQNWIKDGSFIDRAINTMVEQENKLIQLEEQLRSENASSNEAISRDKVVQLLIAHAEAAPTWNTHDLLQSIAKEVQALN